MSYLNFLPPPWNSNSSQVFPLQNRNFLGTTRPQNSFHIFVDFMLLMVTEIPKNTTHLQNRTVVQFTPYRIAKNFRPPTHGIF